MRDMKNFARNTTVNLTKIRLYVHGVQDRNWFLDMIDYLRRGNSTKGYLGRWNRHKLAFGKK